MWPPVYLGPPDFLFIDQRTAYTSKEMRESLEAHGVQLDEASFETPCAIGALERYHAPFRRPYERIEADSAKSSTIQECLDLPVFLINFIVGCEGLCPALLAFLSIPRPARTTSATTQMERACLINSAMNEVEREQARKRRSFELKQKNFRKAKESFTLLSELSAGWPVLVYQSASKF